MLEISSLVEFNRSAVISILDFQIANDASLEPQADPAKDARRTPLLSTARKAANNIDRKRNETAPGNQRLDKLGQPELPDELPPRKDPQAVIYIPPTHSVDLFLCEPLLTTASHKAYSTVLGY